jgi:hypothetical protein
MLFCLPVSLPLKGPIKCRFIDNWFAGVPFLSYRYVTKQICICLQQSRFIASNEIGMNMKCFRARALAGL